MTARPENLGHRIAEISYSRDRLECTCGEVMHANARDGDWNDHRRALGLAVKNVNRGDAAHGPAISIRRRG